MIFSYHNYDTGVKIFTLTNRALQKGPKKDIQEATTLFPITQLTYRKPSLNLNHVSRAPPNLEKYLM